MASVHLVEQYDHQVKVKEPNIWESGNWKVASKAADRLVGGDILFHRGQLTPAYMSGKILGWREIQEGESKGRVVFMFELNNSRVGEFTAKEKWGNEKKYVWINSGSDPYDKTAKTTENMWGDKLFQRRARLALPVLIEWATNRKRTMEYGELADELDMLHHRPTNKILASVGTTLNELQEKEGIEIPPIQVLVVNKSTGLPGAGVGWFISEENYSALSKQEKRATVDEWHQKIYDYNRWSMVLKKLDLPNYNSKKQFSNRTKIPATSENNKPETKFKKWLKNLKSEKTAKNYTQALSSTLSKLARKNDWVQSNIFEIGTQTEFIKVDLKLRSNKEFIALNTKGKGMYSAALNWYERYIRETTSDEIERDMEDILGDPMLGPTMKSTLVKTRLGQGKFRQKLLCYWKACSVTRFSDPKLLVASHIKPWREADNHERMSLYNGLLLTPNLDKCFDSGFVTFKNSGEILIASALEQPQALGISPAMSTKLAKQHNPYMEFHRDLVFKG